MFSQSAFTGNVLIDHLAILVVYFLRDDDLGLLELHLNRIAQHTHVPYTLLASAQRVTPAARALIRAQPNVRLVDIAPTSLRSSREHAYYLDAMLEEALDLGASHICTLDPDSFPIADDWLAKIQQVTPPASGFAGVLRVENGDVLLPHPSCTLASRGFYQSISSSFAPDSDYTGAFRKFLRQTHQAADTGIRIGYELWRRDLPWGHLLRTNVRNPHYLMAAIYADSVFHLGGASRRGLFRRDTAGSLSHRLTSPLERIPFPRGGALQRAQGAMLHRLRGDVEDFVLQRNREAYAALERYLISDPDGMIAYLRGAPPSYEVSEAAADFQLGANP